MDIQAILNFLDKRLFKPLENLILSIMYSYGFFTPARVRYFSTSIVVPLNGRNTVNLQIGNVPAVIERIFTKATSTSGTIKVSRSDLSEDLMRDAVPLTHFACIANEQYNGPPPFKVAANTTLTFEITDTSGSANTIQLTAMVRELVQ